MGSFIGVEYATELRFGGRILFFLSFEITTASLALLRLYNISDCCYNSNERALRTVSGRCQDKKKILVQFCHSYSSLHRPSRIKSYVQTIGEEKKKKEQYDDKAWFPFCSLKLSKIYVPLLRLVKLCPGFLLRILARSGRLRCLCRLRNLELALR